MKSNAERLSNTGRTYFALAERVQWAVYVQFDPLVDHFAVVQLLERGAERRNDFCKGRFRMKRFIFCRCCQRLLGGR
jgi:hypothetical protein